MWSRPSLPPLWCAEQTTTHHRVFRPPVQLHLTLGGGAGISRGRRYLERPGAVWAVQTLINRARLACADVNAPC